MKKMIFLILAIISIIFISSCKNAQVACTQEAKICSDGTAVTRVGPNCEFAECPKNTGNKTCNYDSPEIVYKEKDLTRCHYTKVECDALTQYFSDECGCGCKPKEQIVCTKDQRYKEFCTTEYDVVCGWFNESIKCIKYPCAETFSNPCTACRETRIQFYTKGVCPQ